MGRNQARSRLHELQKFGRLKDDYGNAKYTKAEMAKSGCVITLGYEGKTEIKRGLLKAEDMKAIKAEAKSKGKKAKADVAAAPKAKDPTALTASLAESLTTTAQPRCKRDWRPIRRWRSSPLSSAGDGESVV